MVGQVDVQRARTTQGRTPLSGRPPVRGRLPGPDHAADGHRRAPRSGVPAARRPGGRRWGRSPPGRYRPRSTSRAVQAVQPRVRPPPALDVHPQRPVPQPVDRQLRQFRRRGARMPVVRDPGVRAAAANCRPCRRTFPSAATASQAPLTDVASPAAGAAARQPASAASDRASIPAQACRSCRAPASSTIKWNRRKRTRWARQCSTSTSLTNHCLTRYDDDVRRQIGPLPSVS